MIGLTRAKTVWLKHRTQATFGFVASFVLLGVGAALLRPSLERLEREAHAAAELEAERLAVELEALRLADESNTAETAA